MKNVKVAACLITRKVKMGEVKAVGLTVHRCARLIVIFLRVRSRAPLISTVRLLLLQDTAALTAQDARWGTQRCHYSMTQDGNENIFTMFERSVAMVLSLSNHV